MSLRNRAKAFMKRPVPADVGYVPDSVSERFITAYANEGKVDVNSETGELLQLCVMESAGAAEEGSPERQAYFREICEILDAILAEADAA